MARKFASRIARIVHEAATDAHKAGVMDKTTMREFDALCLSKPEALSPRDIQALREREQVSQAVMARDLNVTTGLISQVTLRVRHAREMAQIDIEDTGPGLTAQEIATIFEPFARGSASAQSGSGAGLGLTIAKMLTDLMGGEMTVSSTPGQGTVFRIKLFLPEAHPGAAFGAHPRAAAPRRRARPRHRHRQAPRRPLPLPA